MRKLLPGLSVALSISMAAELPVREVVLYKHGVGYFERAGDLARGETARLDFKASEMNDVLKSLTVQDTTGKVTGLRYDSSDPLAHKLAEFPFKVDAETASLSAFLNQLKGARIELKFGQDTIAGEIVSARVVPGDDKRAEREQVVVLLDSGEMRTLDLSAATSVKLSDPVLQAQLRDYLRVVAAARSQDKRSVYIDSSDSGTRRLQASYMIPTPVWKSSYRLIFKDEGEPMLEGWAIVDNTSAEDWTNVQLALVSGRPISFISRLYEPKYVQRPGAELAEDQAVAPVVYEGAARDEVDALKDRAAKRSLAAGAVAGLPMAPQMAAEVRQSAAFSNVQVNTAARELGDLFKYRFSTPVTVKKGESAMLPFLQQKIASRKLLVYSDLNAQHPMSAAELTNSTGKTLDGGPITVFDSGSYAGEALVETLKAGDKRLISYAVDLGTRVTTKIDSEASTLTEIHARRGILTTRYAARETRNYTVRNVDQKAMTLVIEHPLRYGYKVLNQKPIETTSTAHRFEVKLAPAATVSFPVTEEREYEQTTQVVNLTPNILGDYLRNVKLSDAARKQLQAIAAKKQEIAANDAAIAANDNATTRLFRDQERLRQNITSLNQVSGQQEQVQKYARSLSDQEAQLVRLRDEQDRLRAHKTQLQSELDSMIDKIEF
jgi:hypothetical protein